MSSKPDLKTVRSLSYPENLLYDIGYECQLNTDQLRALEAIVSTFSVRYQDILRMYYVEKMPSRDIQATLNIGSSRMTLQRREILRLLRRKENQIIIKIGYDAYMEYLEYQRILRAEQLFMVLENPYLTSVDDAGFTPTVSFNLWNCGCKTLEDVLSLMREDSYPHCLGKYGKTIDKKIRKRLAELNLL